MKLGVLVSVGEGPGEGEAVCVLVGTVVRVGEVGIRVLVGKATWIEVG